LIFFRNSFINSYSMYLVIGTSKKLADFEGNSFQLSSYFKPWFLNAISFSCPLATLSAKIRDYCSVIGIHYFCNFYSWSRIWFRPEYWSSEIYILQNTKMWYSDVRFLTAHWWIFFEMRTPVWSSGTRKLIDRYAFEGEEYHFRYFF